MDADIEIAPAKPDDAAQLQEMHYHTWLATYPNEELGITAEDIKDRFKDRLTEAGIEKRRQKIANQNENDRSYVAKQNDRVVGFCHAVKHPDKNQLVAINILPDFQGKGLGTALWQKAENFFDPSKDTIVHVATYNSRAINFYKKLGFEDTGKRFSDERFRMKSGAIIPEMEMIIKTD